MDEVPAIIHRLSLQWVPEYGGRAEQEITTKTEVPTEDEYITDPLASPPQDAVDSSGRLLDASQIAFLTLESSAESHALFSQKTLLRLAALNDSHRTLSLFTPGMKDVVFRAWAGLTECGERFGIMAPKMSLPGELSRNHSFRSNLNTLHSHDDCPEKAGASRPTLPNYPSANSTLQLGRHTKPGRRRKHRVVNLRRVKTGLEESESISGESSVTASAPGSEAGISLSNSSIPEERDGELTTPPSSPSRYPSLQKMPEKRNQREKSPSKHPDATPRQSLALQNRQNMSNAPKSAPPLISFQPSEASKEEQRKPLRSLIRPSRYFTSFPYPLDRPSEPGLPSSTLSQCPSTYDSSSSSPTSPFPYLESSPGGILEQAWMMKMAGMIAKRVEEERVIGGVDFGKIDQSQREDIPPPAYGT